MAFCLNVNEEVERLENQLLIKIATILWKNWNFPVLYETPECNRSQWARCERKVKKNIQKLSLRTSSTEKLQMFVKITGREIFLFMNFLKWTFRDRHYFGTPEIFELILTKLCWTAKGVINRLETFKLFLADESIFPIYRYIISTTFCLQDYFILFYGLSVDEKFLLFNDDTYLNEPIDLISHFSYYMKYDEKMEDFGINCEELFKHELHKSVLNANEHAFEFFLNKLAVELRQEKLIGSIAQLANTYIELAIKDEESGRITDRDIGIYGHISKMLLFFARKIDNDLLISLQKLNFDFVQILLSLLQWPYQDHLLSTLQFLKKFMQKEHYVRLISYITEKIEGKYKDFNYLSLLAQVLEVTFQTRFKIKDENLITSMTYLIEHTDEKCFPLIQNCLTLSMREKLINYNYCIEICMFLDLNLKRDYLKKLINICLPQLKQLKKYKSNCISFVNNNKEDYEILNVNCVENLHFLKFLDEIIGRQNK